MQIITLHSNVHMCGVSKFNRILSSYIAADVIALDKDPSAVGDDLILSISFAEFDDKYASALQKLITRKRYGLIVHGLSESKFQSEILSNALWIMALNEELLERIGGAFVGHLLLGWAPPMITNTLGSGSNWNDIPRNEKQLFMFGMSKKFNHKSLEPLEKILGDEAPAWSLTISAGLHENSTFDDEFFDKIRSLRDSSALNVSFAGFLSDEAVSKHLLTARACLLVFNPAARANNSTLTSALDHGCPVITNTDLYTPSWMIESGGVLDLKTLHHVPLRTKGESLLPDKFGWHDLASIIQNAILVHKDPSKESGKA